MNYAWVIDQTKCIGCHACSTACKSENDVPVGVHRTWVKAVEVGQFPQVRRHFAVLRCNHCANPPCVHICPVSAMHQRSDGIVDIAHDRCIGCKACMQACPYDAIHVDPVDNTVAKCHFCAHRVENGLLPACVVVCPVEALVFGDLDDPHSRVNRYLGSTPVTVRRPEQGTRPKAFYVGAHQTTLDPLAAAHEPSYMWAERQTGTAKDHVSDFDVWSLVAPREDERPAATRERSRMPRARVAYDVHHHISWRGRVSAYLWTKSIAAGVALLSGLAHLTGDAVPGSVGARLAPLVAMVALAATGVLLIADLKRPERFWFILVKPQWRSWLTRGAFVITGFGALLTVWVLYDLWGKPPPVILLVPTTVLAIGTAVYTAFLFGQCEARDLWQSPTLAVHLAVQMVVAGAASLLALDGLGLGGGGAPWMLPLLAAALALHLALAVFGEVWTRHPSANAAAAAHVLTRGRYAALFWSALGAGALVPAVGLTLGLDGRAPLAAGLLALAGLWAYEHAYVMAGQSVPIS